MSRTELLEREAEARRIELAQTFDELRARATPGHMLDQLVEYASDSGGADFFRNLRNQTVANPLALGLMGAGLAWLMMSNGRQPSRAYEPYYDEMEPYRGRTRSYFAGTRERAGDAISGARHMMSDTAHGVRDRVAGAAQAASDAAGSIASTARSARDVAFDTASSLSDQARERAGDTTAALGNAASALYGGVSNSAGRTASGMRAFASGTASTGRDVFEFARDQPLVLAGLGLAFGAAMGAAFPSTETERHLMGEASDDLKERTHALAADSYEKSRSVAGAVYDELQSRARESSEAGSLPQAGHTGIAPIEEDIRGPMRPERIGLRDEHS
jgi:hypothetical protein